MPQTKVDMREAAISSAVEYFIQGCKPVDQFRIGMEVEHFCIRTVDGIRIPYDGEYASVTAVLTSLLEDWGGEAIRQDGNLIGILAPWGKVTLEPGGQIEWSSPPCQSVDDLTVRLRNWLMLFHSGLFQNGVTTLSKGFDAATSIREIPWVPKRRYNIMREHYSDCKQIAYSAMARTAGIHVSLDYSDEYDWSRKFRAMLLLTPITVAIFANSPSDSPTTSPNAIRPAAWLAIDPERCQPPEVAFDPGFEIRDWAAWIVDRPRLLKRIGGELVEALGEPFWQSGVLPSDDPPQWELHLSTIFTPVRCSQHLEVRTVDMQQNEVLPAVPAFWRGLLYSDSISALHELLAPVDSPREWQRLLLSACRDGLRGDPALTRISAESLRLALAGLEPHCDPNKPAYASLLRMYERLLR